MDKKRPLTQNEIEYYANLSDSESDGIFGEDGYDGQEHFLVFLRPRNKTFTFSKMKKS